MKIEQECSSVQGNRRVFDKYMQTNMCELICVMVICYCWYKLLELRSLHNLKVPRVRSHRGSHGSHQGVLFQGLQGIFQHIPWL